MKSGLAGAIAEYVIFADNRAFRIGLKAKYGLVSLSKTLILISKQPDDRRKLKRSTSRSGRRPIAGSDALFKN
jgi:hypothetical protein